MALEEERLSGAVERTNRLLDSARVKSVRLAKIATFARKVARRASAAGVRAFSNTNAIVEKFFASCKDLEIPGWARLFTDGFMRMHHAWAPVRHAISKPVTNFITATLLRRILASNLLGLVFLIAGFLYLNQSSTVLIEEKRRSLEVQAEMIATAIASGAKMRSGQPDQMLIDPDKLPLDRGTLFPTRDDAFTRHEMQLSPEQLAPILIKMVRATKARARVHNFEGRLIIDTASLLTRGQVIRPDAEERRATERPKNIWTRIIEFMIGREFEVYKELESVHATDYPEVNEALRTGENQAMILLTDKGEQTVSAIVPIRRTNSIQGIVILTSREGELGEILRKNRNAVWPLAIVALIASIITSFFLSRTVAGPMKRLSDAAESVSQNITAHQRLPELVGRTDEVGQMAQAFRSMTAALFKRIEGSERFAADVAHELKNPLTAASSTAQSLEYAKTPEQLATLVEQIQGELKRLNRLITDVSSASRLDAELARQAREPVHLDQLLENIVQSFSAKIEETNCKLDFVLRPTTPTIAGSTISDDLIVSGNAGRLAQVMTNLIDNAVSFSRPGGTVTVTAQRLNDAVLISVEDEGPGIDEDKLEAIFDRFYTYRPTAESSRGNNSGLGLNISREIVLAHGGRIWGENRFASNLDVADNSTDDLSPLGARFFIELPVQSNRAKRPT
ncbi:MAG: stimulus-sensing domain-containing protein [Hyphomicrobiaceae bacterium]